MRKRENETGQGLRINQKCTGMHDESIFIYKSSPMRLAEIVRWCLTGGRDRQLGPSGAGMLETVLVGRGS
jgi:hypothetical protein